MVPLVSVDVNLRLYFTAENTEIAEFSLFHFKFSALSACPAFFSGACSAVKLT
jgi:hypothetical protein